MDFQTFGTLAKEGLRLSKGLDCRGKTHRIRFEAPSQINNAPMFLYSSIQIGLYSYARTGTIRYLDRIGRYCSIGPGVTIGEGEHPTTWLSTSPSQYTLEQFAFYPPEKERAKARRVARSADNNDGATGMVAIGNDVWIGGGATIRRGVKIGDGAIIAGNAFVTKDVDPYTIVAGLPAKPVRKRLPDHIVEDLLDLRWWRFDINDLAGMPFDQPERMIGAIREAEAAGKIRPRPEVFSEVLVSSKGWARPE